MFLHLSVIHSVHEGVCIRGSWGRPLTPSDTTGHGQRAGGTHPTGMHYCFVQSNVRLRNIFNPDPLIWMTFKSAKFSLLNSDCKNTHCWYGQQWEKILVFCFLAVWEYEHSFHSEAQDWLLTSQSQDVRNFNLRVRPHWRPVHMALFRLRFIYRNYWDVWGLVIVAIEHLHWIPHNSLVVIKKSVSIEPCEQAFNDCKIECESDIVNWQVSNGKSTHFLWCRQQYWRKTSKKSFVFASCKRTRKWKLTVQWCGRYAVVRVDILFQES